MKKRVKQKVSEDVLMCDVPNCSRPMDMGWKPNQGKNYRICFYHERRHFNEDDVFDLFDVFGIKQLVLGVDVDRFGFPLPRDYYQCLDEAEQREKERKKARTEETRAKLEEWKAENKDRPRYKKPPLRPEEISKRSKMLDDLVGDILGL